MLIIERRDGSLYIRANSVLGKQSNDERRIMNGKKLHQVVSPNRYPTTGKHFMQKVIGSGLISDELLVETDNTVLVIESKKEAS